MHSQVILNKHILLPGVILLAGQFNENIVDLIIIGALSLHEKEGAVDL